MFHQMPGSISRAVCLLFTLPLLLGCAAGSNKSEGNTQKEQKQLQAQLNLGERYLLQGKNRQAIKQFLSVKKSSPNIPRLNFDLGLAYTALNDPDKAISAYRRALEEKPEYGEAWNNLGQVYLSQGKMDKAQKAFEHALDIVTYMTPEKAAYNLARLWRQKGNTKKALRFARSSVDENWRFAPGYILAAELMRKRGNPEEALGLLRQGAEAVPENLELTLDLAESLVRAGNEQEAKKWFKRIAQNNPESQQAEVAQDYLEFLE